MFLEPARRRIPNPQAVKTPGCSAFEDSTIFLRNDATHRAVQDFTHRPETGFSDNTMLNGMNQGGEIDDIRVCRFSSRGPGKVCGRQVYQLIDDWNIRS